MTLCDFGCGEKAKYQFKNGKWCCSKSTNSCQSVRLKKSKKLKGLKRTEEQKKRISDGAKGREPWNKGKVDVYSEEALKLYRKAGKKNKGKIPWNKGKTYEELYGKEKADYLRKKHSADMKGMTPWNCLTIKYLKKTYSFFSKVEKMRYNPDNPKEIQVHCKYNECENSKDNGGWFTPTYNQLYERIRALERPMGMVENNFYCSDRCKVNCSLYRSNGNIFEETIPLYTTQEYQIWRQAVLEQDNYECQKCGSKENLHCHHIIPVKIEPMFSLDPDNGIVLCQDCHYKYGHSQSGCKTGEIANKQCGSENK